MICDTLTPPCECKTTTIPKRWILNYTKKKHIEYWQNNSSNNKHTQNNREKPQIRMTSIRITRTCVRSKSGNHCKLRKYVCYFTHNLKSLFILSSDRRFCRDALCFCRKRIHNTARDAVFTIECWDLEVKGLMIRWVYLTTYWCNFFLEAGDAPPLPSWRRRIKEICGTCR